MSEYEIVMAQEPWDQFRTYTELCGTEIGAFGYCTPKMYDNDKSLGYLYVDEIFLVPQEVSGSEVDFLTEGVPYAVERSIKDDRVEDLRFCIHSHVNMGAFFSGVDDDMIRKMGSTGTPWFASVVFNKKGETAARLDLFQTAVPGLRQITVKAEVVPETQLAIVEECREQMKKFVKKSTPTWSSKSKNKGTSKYRKNGDKHAPRKPTKDKTRQAKGKSKKETIEEVRAAEMEASWEDLSVMEKEWRALHQEAKRRGWTAIEDNDGWITYAEECQGTMIVKGSAPPEEWIDLANIPGVH